MKKILKISLLSLLSLALILGIALLALFLNRKRTIAQYSALLGEEVRTMTSDSLTFRDLNKNGTLDLYEDPRASVEARVEDLLSQMTLQEKAGLLFVNMIVLGKKGELFTIPTPSKLVSLILPPTVHEIAGKKLNHFNVGNVKDPMDLARWQNNMQKMAERTRLGIPVTVASDPRHSAKRSVAAFLSNGLSKWCEPIGLAATRDSSLTALFGEVARKEYRALGIHQALHPMADLATEPRWPRISGTFGEDAELAARLSYAYIKGFQGDSLGPTSVACMSKHFAGGGPQRDGLDPHLPIGKEQVYPGDNFDYHLIPFEKGVFPAKSAAIMPYYGIPMGQTSEDVGFSFNKEMITGLLRGKYGYEGVVCTDWSVLTDKGFGPMTFVSTGWGEAIEKMTPKEKILKAMDAGIDQFGGENLPELVAELVQEGLLTEERVEQSARRILRDKFRLGLFDNPFVDLAALPDLIGLPDFLAAGILSQKKSIVLLENKRSGGKERLPLSKGIKVYAPDIDEAVLAKYATPVKKLAQAEVAIIRQATAFEIKGDGPLAGVLHQGRLTYDEKEKEDLKKIMTQIPTIVDIYMDRPAVMPEIKADCAAMTASFGTSDEALLEVLFGNYPPQGKLPFEIPSSMEAVEKQFEDVPFDSESPLYEYGFGLEYGASL